MSRLNWSNEVFEGTEEITTYHEARYTVYSQNVAILNLEFQITEIQYPKADDWVVSAACYSSAEEVDKYMSLNDDCLSLNVAKQICEDWLDTALEDLKSQI